jgi:diacylglycerol kinase (CTP)
VRSHDTSPYPYNANDIVASLASHLADSLLQSKRAFAGLIHSQSLPLLPLSWLTSHTMASRSVPRTPRVISATPTPTEVNGKDYFGPLTRSVSRAKVTPIQEDLDSTGSEAERRARIRTPSRRKAGHLGTNGAANGTTNGHLQTPERKSARDISRSPSPLGIIPIHSRFRTFVGTELIEELLHFRSQN